MRRLFSILIITALMLSLLIPASAADSGYTVKMSTDQSVSLGGTVSIPVTVGSSGDTSVYNAVDMTFSYDTSILKLTSTTISGFTVIQDGRTVRVLGYGQDRSVGSTSFTLVFQAIGSGVTLVTINQARVDASNHAISSDAPLASILDTETVVSVSGYPVTLPDGFSGASTATPGKDYTFSKPNNGKDYYIIAKVNGVQVSCKDNGNGTYTIAGKDVNGPIIITAYIKTKPGPTPTPKPGKGGTDVKVDGLWAKPYVELNGRTVFLIAAAGNPGKNKTYAFDGEPMYYTEKYTSPTAAIGEKVYVYLTILEQGQALEESEVASRITVVSAEKTTLLYGFDVNDSGKSDISDAKMIYDAYNGVYWGFDELPIQRFLSADINLDGMVNVKDAAAIVAHVN